MDKRKSGGRTSSSTGQSSSRTSSSTGQSSGRTSSSTGQSSGRTSSSTGQSSRRVAATKILTGAHYKHTYEEAIKYKLLPIHERFDVETGYLKEEHDPRNRRTPPPPSGTTVYEVETGRRFRYEEGFWVSRCYPNSWAMEDLRESAAAAGVLPAHLMQDRSRPEKDAPATSTTCTKTGRGGLRRVIPLPLPAEKTVLPRPPYAIQDEDDDSGGEHSDTTPDDVSSQIEGPPPPVRSRRSGVQLDVCNCIALVTADSIRLETCKPDLLPSDGETYIDERRSGGLLGKSQTLRYLRNGYRNYVENDMSHSVHVLTAYTCRSVRPKVVEAYKSISCKEKGTQQPGEGKSTTTRSEEADLYKLVATVNQYLNVFSVLADFNYTWLTPSLKGGVCNAMVVDKYWVYSDVRNVYIPHYRLLPGDEYTDFAVTEIRKLNNRGTRIKYLKFVSTANTTLYTNRQALVRHESGDRERRGASGPTITPPPKKRRFVPTRTDVHHDHGHGAASSSTTSYGLRTSGWPEHEHNEAERTPIPTIEYEKLSRENLDPRPAAAAPAACVKNPTLVVFKHNLDETEPDTLICNITVEMSLTDRIVY